MRVRVTPPPKVAHTGDALDTGAACVPGGFSGIIVDLFAKGELLPQLTQAGVLTGYVLAGCARGSCCHS